MASASDANFGWYEKVTVPAQRFGSIDYLNQMDRFDPPEGRGHNNRETDMNRSKSQCRRSGTTKTNQKFERFDRAMRDDQKCAVRYCNAVSLHQVARLSFPMPDPSDVITNSVC
jgi:hypothetical protein